MTHWRAQTQTMKMAILRLQHLHPRYPLGPAIPPLHLVSLLVVLVYQQHLHLPDFHPRGQVIQALLFQVCSQACLPVRCLCRQVYLVIHSFVVHQLPCHLEMLQRSHIFLFLECPSHHRSFRIPDHIFLQWHYPHLSCRQPPHPFHLRARPLPKLRSLLQRTPSHRVLLLQERATHQSEGLLKRRLKKVYRKTC